MSLSTVLKNVIVPTSLALLLPLSVALKAEPIIFLEQNWTEKDRDNFYFVDQGSRLLPYDYFLHLENANDTSLLRSDQSLARLGFITAIESPNNPDGLAVGMSKNKDYLGLSCAACHTQQIQYKDARIRIDGGQSFMDLSRFLAAITLSLKTTLDDESKFDRFQKRLLGNHASVKEKNELRKNLNTQYQIRKRDHMQNFSSVPTGYSRLDAFGAILNRALVATGEKNNTHTPNAPTSFPYIWDTPQHDYVEWNGSQSNSGVGALARNIGEVIGVFGDVVPEKHTWLGLIDRGYKSSIQTKNLRKLEKKVATLHSPTWPSIFPKIDKVQAKQGRVLYQKYCGQCHVDINRTDPNRYIKVRMSTLPVIGTDPLMAENALYRKGKTGKFAGRKRYYIGGDELTKTAPAIHIANNLMVGILKNNPLQSYLAKRDAKKLGHPESIHPPKYVDGEIIEHGKEVSNYALLAYKARPLNGIWTGGPYLHNGSVPNLYQLLLPANERMTKFPLGSQQFDPVNVGYDVDSSLTNEATDTFIFDTTLTGNSNAGHEYGTGEAGDGLPALTEQERWALVEYLKTL